MVKPVAGLRNFDVIRDLNYGKFEKNIMNMINFNKSECGTKKLSC